MPAIGTVWTFNYTGSEQLFKIPANGTYKIETWGAQGGGTQPGDGGYAVGYVLLNSNSITIPIALISISATCITEIKLLSIRNFT